MRVLFTYSHRAGLTGISGGVRRLIDNYKMMLEYQGIETKYIDQYKPTQFQKDDLVHFAPANSDMLGFAKFLVERKIPYVISPILDFIYSNSLIRLSCFIDKIFRQRFISRPGAARWICLKAKGICLMSQHERERLKVGLGVKNVPTVIGKPALKYLLGDTNADKNEFISHHFNKDFILFVGNVASPFKNVHRLIKASQSLNIPLVLIGTIHDTPYGKYMIETIKKAKNVKYYGVLPQNELASAMKACKIFAMPSLIEGLGLAALEAGASGARIVITSNGGPKDYFSKYAWYVNPKSNSSITHQLDLAWNSSNPPPIERYLQSSLSIDICSKNMVDFYKNIYDSLN